MNRFNAGETLAEIALIQGEADADIDPVLPSTVASHVLDALLYARHTVNLARVSAEFPPPGSSEWFALCNAEMELGIDVVEGNADKYKKALIECACPYSGSQEERNLETFCWYPIVNWYIALRRISYEPAFLDNV